LKDGLINFPIFLQFPAPRGGLNFRARAKGWNHDDVWEEKGNYSWTGTQYECLTRGEALPGERPIVVFVGKADKTAVQFFEFNGEFVGKLFIYFEMPRHLNIFFF
jgi:hypothetical protein